MDLSGWYTIQLANVMICLEGSHLTKSLTQVPFVNKAFLLNIKKRNKEIRCVLFSDGRCFRCVVSFA